MTTLVVEQPNYIPWLGYFDLLDRADVWVWYDDVQYTRRDWRNRNRVAGDGDPVWLTIPVQAKDHRLKRICEIEIDYRLPWIRKHLSTLRHLYAKAPFFAPVFELVHRSLDEAPKLLADLTIGLNEEICHFMEIEAVFLRSSRLRGIEGTKEARILSVCRQLRPATYLSGPSASAYLEALLFEREGIELRYISYRYYEYPRDGYRPNTSLSILDPLFWVGPHKTLELIRSNPREHFLLTPGHD